MSAKDCIDEVNRAVGRDLTHEELDALFRDLQRRQRRLKALQGEGAEETIMRAADEAADDILTARIIEKRNAALNLRKRLEALDYVRSQFGKKQARGLEAVITGVNSDRAGSRYSAVSEQMQLTGKYTQGFIADVEKSGHWQLFVSGEFDRDIARAMWAKADGRTIDVPREAREIGDLMHKWQEMARYDANRAGAWIKRMPGYIVRQSHDMFKIRKSTYEEWRSFILERLDDQTFDGVDDTEAFLRSVHEGLASGVHLAHGGDAPTGFKGFANIAKKMSQDRVLHFKDADAWFDYNKRFGTGNLRESFLFGLQRTAHQTGLMRVWGPNPRMNYDQVHREILDEITDPAAKTKFQADKNWLDNRFDEVDGSINIPGNVIGARWSSGIRAVQSMAKLGGATLSAIADIPIAASELRYQGVGFLESHLIPMQALLRGRGSFERRQILGMLGVMMDGMAGNIVHRFSAHDDLPGGMARLLRTFFKYNGLTWWTDSMSASVGMAMSHRLAMNADIGWAGIDPDLRRTLGLFGIDEGKWDMLRVGNLAEADGRSFMVPEVAREISDDAARDYLGSRATDAQIRRLKEEVESQLRSYFVDRVEYAVIKPDARTNAVLRRGTRPGTIEGEAFRFFAQFKSFPVAVLQKSVGRELYGRGANSLGDALKNGTGEMLGLANLIIGTTLFGYLAMSAKDMAKGRTPRDPRDPKTWLGAATQGGGAGIYGDFLFGETKNRFGQGALDTFFGPTFGTATSLADLYGRVRDGDDASASAFNALINNAPFANLFYTRAALDYLLLYQLREAMNPGYLRRMERRIERENAQKFIVQPSSAARSGLPAAIQEATR